MCPSVISSKVMCTIGMKRSGILKEYTSLNYYKSQGKGQGQGHPNSKTITFVKSGYGHNIKSLIKPVLTRISLKCVKIICESELFLYLL